jgi:hypothetical protein
MDYLDYIYFDTSALLSENWPQLSAKLISCLQLADPMGKKICLPSVVEQELEIKWLANFDGNSTQLKKLIEKINKHLLANESVKVELPDREVALKEYRKKVQELKDLYHIVSIDRPRVDKDTLINMAINYDPPFEENDKGFKDAIILFSVIEHLQSIKFHSGAIISGDRVFQDDRILEVAKKQGLSLKIIASMEQLLEELKATLGDILEKEYRLEQEKAASALEKDREKISEFILDNLEFNIGDLRSWRSKLGGEIVKIDKLELVTLKNVILARLVDRIKRKEEGRFPISFEAEIVLSAVVFKTPPPESSVQKNIKVGEAVPTPRAEAFKRLMTVQKYEAPIQTTGTLNLVVTVEATAEIINEEYNNIELISVQLRKVI